VGIRAAATTPSRGIAVPSRMSARLTTTLSLGLSRMVRLAGVWTSILSGPRLRQAVSAAHRLTTCPGLPALKQNFRCFANDPGQASGTRASAGIQRPGAKRTTGGESLETSAKTADVMVDSCVALAAPGGAPGN